MCSKEEDYQEFDLGELFKPKPWYVDLYYFLYRLFYYKPLCFLREVKYSFQRLRRGYSDSDLWNLDVTLAEFIYPRVKAFRDKYAKNPFYEKPKDLSDQEIGLPVRDGSGNFTVQTYTEKEWLEVLDKIVFAFERTAKEFDCSLPPLEAEEEQRRVAEGLQLFVRHLHHLWD
jgi:hypothetical protein